MPGGAGLTASLQSQPPPTLKKGVLTAGSDIPFPPFEFRKGGKLTGFDVDLVEELARRLGLKVKWVDAPFETIFTQLAGGGFDLVASATTITAEREKIVDFSRAYYRAQQALTVNVEETPRLRSVNNLRKGDVVAVQRGTTGEAWARKNLGPKGVQIRSFAEAPDTYTTLEAGNVTAVIFDEPSAVDEAKRRPALAVVATIDTKERYGFAIDPRNDRLRAAVNRALQAMVATRAYQRIYAKWFPGAPAGSVAGS